MDDLWKDPELVAVCSLALVTVLLGLAGLMTGLGRKGKSWAVILGLAALAGLAAAAFVLEATGRLWLPPLALVGACGLFAVLRAPGAPRAGPRPLSLLKNPRLQAATLLAAGPAVLLGWLSWVVATGRDPTPMDPDRYPRQVEPELTELPLSGVLTDRG